PRARLVRFRGAERRPRGSGRGGRRGRRRGSEDGGPRPADGDRRAGAHPRGPRGARRMLRPRRAELHPARQAVPRGAEEDRLMAPRPLEEVVEAGWAAALAPVAPVIADMGAFLRAELAAGRRYLPAGANVLRAFQQPFHEVRVLIVGQDPYPTPGHAIG